MFGLKKKLMAATSMLVVSAMMLTTASFAWFTISTNPEISGLTTSVVTNENLEIAVAKESDTEGKVLATDAQTDYSSTSMVSNYYTYGNLVDFATTDNALTTAYAAFQTAGGGGVLAPMALNSTSALLQYAEYGLDGRVSSLTTAYQKDYSDGTFGYITNDEGEVYGYYVDYWIRSNVAGTLSLQTAEANRVTGEDSTLGDGSYFTTANVELADAVLVAFDVIDTTGTYTMVETNTVMSSTTIVGAEIDTAATTTGTPSAYVTTYKSDTIATLVAEQDTLVRMYVYLDGTLITNNSATTRDVTSLTGSLNIQFQLTPTTNSTTALDAMDVDFVSVS